MPCSSAGNVNIDSQGNIWHGAPNGLRSQSPTRPPALKNCKGAFLTEGISTDYGIENAVGDGLVVQGDGVIINNAQINGASGNGMTVTGGGCVIDGGFINGARGVGIMVTGNGNVIKNVTFTNCFQPIIVRGQGNVIDWKTIRTVSEPAVQVAYPQSGAYTQNGGDLYNSEVQGRLMRPVNQPMQLRANPQSF